MAERSWRDQTRLDAETTATKNNEALLSDYLAVFNTPAGRDVLADLIRESNRPSVGYEKLTSELALVKEGKRMLTDYILKRVDTAQNRKQ